MEPAKSASLIHLLLPNRNKLFSILLSAIFYVYSTVISALKMISCGCIAAIFFNCNTKSFWSFHTFTALLSIREFLYIVLPDIPPVFLFSC